jgi:hypothetical protein
LFSHAPQSGSTRRQNGPFRLNERQREITTFRPRPDVCRFFDGLDLIEPGVVQPHRWRPGPGDLSPDQEITAWCGVARKS